MTIDRPRPRRPATNLRPAPAAPQPNGIAFASPVDLMVTHHDSCMQATCGQPVAFDLTAAARELGLTAGPVFKTPAAADHHRIVAPPARPVRHAAVSDAAVRNRSENSLTNTNPRSTPVHAALYGVWDWNLSATMAAPRPRSGQPRWLERPLHAAVPELTRTNTGLPALQ